jgi:hypothetical protein
MRIVAFSLYTHYQNPGLGDLSRDVGRVTYCILRDVSSDKGVTGGSYS